MYLLKHFAVFRNDLYENNDILRKNTIFICILQHNNLSRTNATSPLQNNYDLKTDDNIWSTTVRHTI